MAPGGHIEDEILETYSKGDMSEAESAPVEEHLLVCQACRDRLDDWDAYVRSMKGAAARVRQTPEPAGWRQRWFGGKRVMWGVAFAGIAVLLLVAGVRMMHGPRAQAVVLVAMRGSGEAEPLAQPGTPLELTLDIAGLPAMPEYRIEIVNDRGESVFERAAAAAGSKVTIRVGARKKGLYFVRVYGPERNLLREYSLPVGVGWPARS